MKKITPNLLCLFLLIVGNLQAQQSINNDAQDLAYYESVKHAQALWYGKGIVKDQAKAVELLKPHAEKGNTEAAYLLGMSYKKGIGINRDINLAFSYIQKAALQDHPDAACELGVLYKDGLGCKLDFDTAIQWFTKAEELGNSKGSYSIGYMHLKGLGSVAQNYDEAIRWFEKSDYPMAKHWLAVCHYMGYGTAVDKNKALELFLSNPTNNSKHLLAHFESNPNMLNLGIEKENAIKATEFSASKINETISSEVDGDIIEITTENLEGDWNGKLVELDWSGERIERSFPISVTFSKKNNKLKSKITIEGNTITTAGPLLGSQYQFGGNNITVPRLLKADTVKSKSKYRLLSLNDMEIKKLNNIQYLVADVEAKEVDFREPATPMLIVLGNTKALTDNGEEIDEALIAELADVQGDNFITLYPNPFRSDLLIQYDLEESAHTSVAIYSMDGQFSQTIVAGEQQSVGNHLYHIDGANFRNGLYVVRVTANNVVNTKLIIKE